MGDMYIEGYAIVYNAKTVLYEYDGIKYYEIISPQALDGCDISDVVLRYNHSDQLMAVASTKNGSLKLFNDTKGLRFQAKLANTTVGKDLYEMIKGQYVQKCSFAFITEADEFDVSTKTRTIKKIKKLIDCSAVDTPAYPQTSLYILDESRQKNQAELEEVREEVRENIKKSNLKHEKILLIQRAKAQEKKLEVESLKNKIKLKG